MRYDFEKELNYHDSFVYAIQPDVGGNGFYTASKDMKIIHVDQIGNPNLIFEGHQNVVNSLSQAVPEEIVSGSWDGCARIWNTQTGQTSKVMEGHAHAVAVLTLPN